MIITSTTPLYRYVLSNEWFAVTAGGLLPAYTGVAQDPIKDRAFGFHALFALSWIVMAYVQICWMDSFKRTSMHRIFGYLTFMVLMLHAMGALLILYEDVEGHSLLNKALLFSSLFSTVYNVARSIKEAVNKNLTAHRILMVQAFISSLDGAGTIRTVSAIQMVMGYGPISCQCAHGSVGGYCDWTYTWRLMWIIFLRVLQWAVYAKAEHPRLVAQLWVDVKTYYIPLSAQLVVSYLMGFTQEQSLVMVVAFNIMRTVDFSKFKDQSRWLAMDLSDTKSPTGPQSHGYRRLNKALLSGKYRTFKEKLRSRLAVHI